MRLLKNSITFTVFFVVSTVNAIVGGHDALEAQFPYQAFITTYKNFLKLTHHSGAVLSKLFVITTKSAVVNGTQYVIKVGSITPTNVYLTSIPPFFPPTDKEHIALLQLEREITFDCHVQPVTLPLPYNGGDSSDVPNYIAQTTGFTPDGRLQFLNVHVVTPSRCSQQWPEYQNWNTTLCTRSVGSYDDLPNGFMCKEQGAPLVVLANRTLVGIFDNSTIACGQEVYAQYLFIKIEPYADWIRTIVDLTHIHNYKDDNHVGIKNNKKNK